MYDLFRMETLVKSVVYSQVFNGTKQISQVTASDSHSELNEKNSLTGFQDKVEYQDDGKIIICSFLADYVKTKHL